MLSKMDTASMTRHCHQETAISPLMLKSALRIALPINENAIDMIMPIAPEYPPSIADSAIKTRDISRFLAPMERKTPISLRRSSTEV